jgi:DNA-binding XRE family transcriptional regulator
MPTAPDNFDAHDYAERIRERLPRRLQELREAAGFTKYGLARESGVSLEFIGKIERGKALPAAPQLVPRNDGENPEWRKIETAWRETELHQTGSTLTPLDFTDFIRAAENPLSKATDGKPGGVEPGGGAMTFIDRRMGTEE